MPRLPNFTPVKERAKELAIKTFIELMKPIVLPHFSGEDVRPSTQYALNKSLYEILQEDTKYAQWFRQNLPHIRRAVNFLLKLGFTEEELIERMIWELSKRGLITPEQEILIRLRAQEFFEIINSGNV